MDPGSISVHSISKNDKADVLRLVGQFRTFALGISHGLINRCHPKAGLG